MAMTPDEALKLLQAGPRGVYEWNRRRKDGETIPSFYGADLSDANLREADLRGAGTGCRGGPTVR